MDYAKIYDQLIKRAEYRHTYGYTERHHIVPRSCGGEDNLDNLVSLTIREHYLAHLLLYKMGFLNQIFSVECFLIDSLNCEHRRYKVIKYKRWIRRAIAKQRAFNQRKAFRNRHLLNI
jgi:5-methylcytosine-specific restriction endonuclease McrA